MFLDKERLLVWPCFNNVLLSYCYSIFVPGTEFRFVLVLIFL
uniref:Uncharacterized protein n=1 Tax=Anguilla anguilla TaxID=7936 RepID=A0A0E9UWJ3_ANGAN